MTLNRSQRGPFTSLVLTDVPPELAARVGAIAADLTARFPQEDIRYGASVTEFSPESDELMCEAAIEIENGGRAFRAGIAAWSGLLDMQQVSAP